MKLLTATPPTIAKMISSATSSQRSDIGSPFLSPFCSLVRGASKPSARQRRFRGTGASALCRGDFEDSSPRPPVRPPRRGSSEWNQSRRCETLHLSSGGGGLIDRLDEEKLELLARWGEGLLNDGREELKAAGRAILLLVEEVERLHVDVWNAREEALADAEAAAEAAAAEPSHLGTSLQRRLRALRLRGSPPTGER